jgi:hypothetical protein
MTSVEKAYFDATAIEVSSRWRIANLIKNAKIQNTVITTRSVTFSCFIDTKNTIKLVYTVPVRFLTNSQLTYLQALVARKL